jgi:ribosome-associated protein
MNDEDYEDTEEELVSKSQRKRDSHALQALGEELVALPVDQFNKIDLPENLRIAIMEARRIHQRGARKRQLQYVGRLMRDVDAAPIQEQLDTLRGCSQRAAQQLHHIERWRDRLLAEGDSALEELLHEHPHADVQNLRQLLRNAHKEALANKPPSSARALFRSLRELLEDQSG